MTRPGLLLVRTGAGLLAVAALFSLWASPTRMRSLPYVLLVLAGVVLVLAVSGRWLPALARRVTTTHLAVFFVCADVIALGAALFGSRWPSYKLAWLNAIYAAIPSMRSLPFSWAAKGLQPNQAGGILAVCTAFTVAVALSPGGDATRKMRWPAVFLSVAGFVVVFMTGSRAALAALTVALLGLLLLRTLRWVWVWASVIGTLLVGLFASGRLSTVIHFFLRDESLDTKLVARLDIWSSAVRGIDDHLLTGIGLHSFNQVMPARYPYRTVGLSYPVSQAHNLVLDVALAIGLPGILGLLCVLVGSILLAVRCAGGHGLARRVGLGVLASIVAFLVFGITDSISFSTPTSFIIWVWACALALLYEREHAPTGA